MRNSAARGRGRVAMLMPSLAGGGAERIFIEVARGLVDLDFAVDIVVVREEGQLVDSIPAGARLVGLHASRTALAGRSLRRYLARERPTVMFSALDPTNALNVVATHLVHPRVPSIVTQHNTVSMVAANATSRRERFVIAANRWLFRRASRVVAVSEGVADDMATTLHLDRRSIDVIYNPVISARHVVEGAQPATHPWLRDKAGPVLLAAGRLTPAKDFPTLIRALALLPADHRLIILGEGDERDALVALARDLGVGERVDVHGFVANPFPFFAAVDVFVLSSQWEGLPTVLIEALPFSCGIVSTDCPSGPREILEDGRWGRLVSCADPTALAEAIRGEITSPRVRPPAVWARYQLDYAVAHYAQLVDDLRRDDD